MPDSSTPTFSPLTSAEEQWLRAHLAEAPALIASFIGRDPEVDGSFTLDDLDEMFTAWLATGESDANAINTVINVLGVAFGSILVRDAGFEWVIATDAYGTDLAIRALPGKGDILVYPANFVAKRWERRESPFFAHGYEQIVRTVRETQAAWRGSA